MTTASSTSTTAPSSTSSSLGSLRAPAVPDRALVDAVRSSVMSDVGAQLAEIKAALASLPLRVGSSGNEEKSQAPRQSTLAQLRAALDGGRAVRARSAGNQHAVAAAVSDDVDDDEEDDGDVGHVSATPAASYPSSEERIASAVLAEARVYGSMVAWVRSAEWKNARNLNECRAAAGVIDKLLEEGIQEDSIGLEMLIRRVMGVHLADSTGNWGVCDALQWSGPNSSLLPRAALTSALRQAAQMERLTKQTNKNGGGGRGNFGNYGDRDRDRDRGGNRGGRGGRGRGRPQQQPNLGAPAATGGAAQQ